ncbi:coiled-coil domain-containing protein 60 [Pyxicephalus adspersus]|uniref:coiled-coil domain-containing protein 60 n=1 Tax=Pyxicephalus adspersus TaxID=30357 RepID=UPI003B5C4550
MRTEMPGNAGHPSDPKSYVVIQPLPIPSQKGLKIQARSATHYNCWVPCRDEIFRANYYRRQKQLSQQGYNSPNYKPYEELGQPLFLEAKKLILHSLGQDELDTKNEDTVNANDTPEDNRSESSSKPSLSIMHETSVHPRHRKNNTNSFNSTLNHTRRLISSVKQGRRYFHMLHQEEEASKLKVQEKQCQLQERNKTEPRPYRDSDDSSADEEEISTSVHKTGFFLTQPEEQQKKQKRSMSRPFTPMHNCLLSKQVLKADPESLFRQLCALHWLIESSTEPTGLLRPVSTCWNIRDPGGCKTSLKRINREKEVEMKWEQFIMPGKGKRQGQKFIRGQLQRARKLSSLSNFRFSGLSSAVTPSMGSVSSLIPSSDEMPVSSDGPQDGGDDIESTVNSSVHTPGKLSKEEDEEPLSDYMQTLLKMIGESVSKELDEEESQSKYKLKIDISSTEIKEKVATNDQIFPKSITQRPKSSPASVMSPTSLFIKRKSNMPSEMKKLFFETADEAEIYLHDKVEAMERRRQEFNTKKYRSLNTISNFRQDLEKMRKANCHIKEEKNYTDTKNWFVVLQSRIPEDMKNNQIKKILEKLEKLEEKNFVRIRPHSFLKVLAGLRNWELCSPDICVAIEFVREHLVQMPSEDYTTWLQTKLTSSSSHRVQSAPPQR